MRISEVRVMLNMMMNRVMSILVSVMMRGCYGVMLSMHIVVSR